MDSFLDKVYYNNTIYDYLFAFAFVIVGTVGLFIIKVIFLKRLVQWSQRTESVVDDMIVNSIERFGIAALQFGIIFSGINFLNLSDRVQKILYVAGSVIVTYFILRLISTIILLLLQQKIRSQEGGENKIKQLGGLMLLVNIVIWMIGVVFLLDKFGQPVTTIITGLGIGGIAIALAAQNILGDLFNYFVIFFDRPFEAGDFITVDDKAGTVEYVGIKTTRIRSLSGEQIIIGNSNLTNSRIHNFKRLINRRVVFSLNIDYRTPVDKVKAIPGMLRQIVENQSPVLFDRAHFATYGDWSLKFEVVYLCLDPDYNKFMDVQQAINIEILETMKRNDIHLAATPHFSFVPFQAPLAP
jgi:small-conductance mechanosensitive channel